MKDIEAFVLSQTMQNSSYWLRVRNWIFEFDDSFGFVGVNVCSAAYSYVAYSVVKSSGYLSDNILFFSPNWNSLLRLDTEFASSLESDTALVEFDLVSQWAGSAIFCNEVGVSGDTLALRSRLRPLIPLLGATSLVFPLTRSEEIVESCVGVLHCTE